MFGCLNVPEKRERNKLKRADINHRRSYPHNSANKKNVAFLNFLFSFFGSFAPSFLGVHHRHHRATSAAADDSFWLPRRYHHICANCLNIAVGQYARSIARESEGKRVSPSSCFCLFFPLVCFFSSTTFEKMGKNTVRGSPSDRLIKSKVA